MRVPESLVPLFDYGVLDEVVRPLMSGKEAHVYLVISGGRHAVAKIYKDAENRSFKHRAEYTEGRKVRNTRDQRAIANRSKHGREKDEAAWRSTEVDMIHRLHAAGVRVPVPYHFVEGVLLMELVTDADGHPAPRLGDLQFDASTARAMYDRLVRAAVQMLCAGVVHGDLSEFNVLVGADGPVIIDFPQSIDSAHNTNARKLLIRDVDNLHRFLARHAPPGRRVPLAEEMWSLHEQNLLTPDTRLRGDFRVAERAANTASVLELIGDANRDERKRRDALGLRGGPASQDRAPKKEAPVYQGLKDEGLKFFRHLRDKPRGGSEGAGQRRGPARNGPPPQQQRSQHQRPPAQEQPPQALGQRPRGERPQGQQPQAQRPQGQHPQGQQPRGQQPHGRQAQGHPQGQHPQAQRPQRQHPQAQRPQGQQPQGQQPRAQQPRGQGPKEQDPRRQQPQVHYRRGQQPQGQDTQAQHPRGEQPQGQDTQAQHPRGEQLQGQETQARYPRGQQSQGQDSQARYPRGPRDSASEAPRPERARSDTTKGE